VHLNEWIKVNAPVDRGISRIVSALSEFPELETIESCEGDNNPWVCFRYGSYWDNPWHDLAEFVFGYLSAKLYAIVGDDVNISIHATPSGNIFGELSIRPGATDRAIEAISALAKVYNDSIR